MAMSDLDHDGVVDLVVADASGLSYMIGQEPVVLNTPLFASPQHIIDGTIESLSIGDINGDGFDDIVGMGSLAHDVSDTITSWVLVHPKNLQQSWSKPFTLASESPAAWVTLTLHDANQDGAIDIWLARNSMTQPDELLINLSHLNSSPAFEKPLQASQAVPTWEIKLADIDFDGYFEALYQSSQHLFIDRMTTHGSKDALPNYLIAPSAQTKATASLEIGDFALDGFGQLSNPREDLILGVCLLRDLNGEQSNKHFVYFHPGMQQNATHPEPCLDSENLLTTAVADLDGDADLDLVALGQQGTLVIFYNQVH